MVWEKWFSPETAKYIVLMRNHIIFYAKHSIKDITILTSSEIKDVVDIFDGALTF